MDLFEAIRGRRSIRKYESKEISDDLVEKVLNSARWAPSWANTQCWRFVVVRRSETKRALAETLSPKNPAKDAMIEAPVVIVGCAKRKVSGYYKGSPATEKGDWYMFDSALAMQNLMLAAHALGLGTVQTGFFDAEKAKEILEIPENIELVTMTPLGYPAEEGRQTRRKELNEIVFKEKYGKSS